MDTLPHHVLVGVVLPLLASSGEELSRCAFVSTAWHAAVEESDAAWLVCCRELWRGKEAMPDGTPQDPFPWFRLTTDVINGLSVKQLRQLLRLRRIDHSGFLEKSEFRKEFVATMPREVQGWARAHRNIWQASYVYSLFDARRGDITKDELCGATWKLYFKQHGMQVDFSFEHDYRVNSPIRAGITTDTRWTFAGYNPRMVQVDRYPPHLVTRRAHDWGWKMENQWVVFYSEAKGTDSRALFTKDYPEQFQGQYTYNQ